ncbi:MAG: PilW family protein [Burkholderiales bacterium]|nr:PilW family protein [Burkholderiales bacterium]
MDSAGRAGFDVGDKVVFVGTGAAPPCVLQQITDRPAADPLQLEHAQGGNDANQGGVAAAFTPASGFAYNLGPLPRRNVWQVSNRRLVVADATFGVGTVLEMADGIVDLQAEYGVDANGNGLVEDSEWTTATPAGANWRALRALRVGLLARSAQWDRAACSPNPQWTSGASGALVRTNFTMTNADGTADGFAGCAENPPSPNNWRRYRYSVYETVIPLRNMIWGTAP